MAWVDDKMKELEEKGKNNWDEDDWDAYNYCEECKAEDARDEEYLSSYSIIC